MGQSQRSRLEGEEFSLGHVQFQLLGHPGVARSQALIGSEVPAGDTELGNWWWVSGACYPQGRSAFKF